METSKENPPLPAWDDTKTKQQQGMYSKFTVARTDGSSAPGGKHEGCEYFVLDVDHDPFAKAALLAYWRACSKEYPLLAMHMAERFDLLKGE